MRDRQNEAWVTGVVSESHVSSALVLCQSLKEVLTSRKLVVIVAREVTLKSRKVLRQTFDYLFSLDDEEFKSIGGHVSIQEFALLFAFTLQSFKKLVWLDPNMFAVTNCDAIFSLNEHQPFYDDHNNSACQYIACLPNMDTSISLLTPSLRIFNSIVESLHLREEEDNSFADFLQTWFVNQSSNNDDHCRFIDGKYKQSLSISEKDEALTGGRDYKDIFLAQLNANVASLVDNGFRNPLLQRWKQIFRNLVQPLLSSQQPLRLPISDKYSREPIAVIGMSCRYPKSSSIEEFWSLLFTGADGTGPPGSRWRREQVIRNPDDFKDTNAGFLSNAVDEFDSKFFGISNKEAVFMDPQQRLLHEVVWESIEDAAINPHSLRGQHGSVFIGSWVTDYKDILHHSGHKDFYRLYMGCSIGAAAARISFLLGMTGPSIATESGCSSAMVAVHMACKSLLSGESHVSLACGVNLLLHPFDKDEIPMALAPDGRCKTFSSDANGFGRAEGCAVLVLKRLSDALKDGDRVWALLRGSAMTQEGASKSMGTPTVLCEAMAMTQALRDAGVNPEQVSYVEAHGTGTVVGDPLEVSAIAKAYHSKKRKEPLMIGSVKTNIGHTEACAGIAGLMKVILALNHDVIPPHINFHSLNPAIKLEAVPAIIPLTPVEWKRTPGKPRYAGVSAFGIAGTDVHVIVEETPRDINKLDISAECHLERPLHLVKMSAKTEEALQLMLVRYRDHVKVTPEDDCLADIAFTANTGRASFRYRTVVIAKSKEDFIETIDELLAGSPSPRAVKGEVVPSEIFQGKICFLFTGQGSQYPGMSKTLYDTSPVFKVHFDHCEKFLRKIYKIQIKEALWGSKSEEIGRTIYSQTSIFCVEYALFKLWESWGLHPDFVLGHSLGEFCASVCAGILSVEDALKLVAERSLLIDQLPSGKMLVIKQDKERVISKLKKFSGNNRIKSLDIAAVNSSDQTVVAGDTELILEFSNFLQDSNVKCLILDASHAFHSKHMDPVLESYRQVAKTVKSSSMRRLNCEYISGLRGSLLKDNDTMDPEYWVEHTREKVNFLDASKKAIELGCRFFIEMGPHPILSALTMMNATSDARHLTFLPSLKKKQDDWSTILHSLAKLYTSGIDINWYGFDRCYPRRRKVRIPHYPFIRKKFWPHVMAITGAKVHPILGAPIPNSSCSKIFECGLNLGSSLEYLKDHAIGNNVVFPGAAFLEMSLAAGVAAIEPCVKSLNKPTRPVKIEDLTIEAPLCLQESSNVQVQAIVENDPNCQTDLLVKITHRVTSDVTGNKWLCHSKAKFCPLPSPQEQIVERYPLEKIIIDEPDNKTEVNVNEIYDKLSAIGLNFGPIFRSVEKLWWKQGKNSDLVVKVKAPLGDRHMAEYLMHPVILDAMLQAIMMLIILSDESEQNKLRRKLYVPIKIGKFVWLSVPPPEGLNYFEQFYIRIYQSCQGVIISQECTAVLMDSNGTPLAVMSGVEVIDTTVKAVESIIQQQLCPMPDLWEETWKKKIGPFEHRIDLDQSLKGQLICNKEIMDKFKGLVKNPSPVLVQVYKLLMEYSWLSMLRALYDCGWSPQTGNIFQTDDLFKELGIQEEHRLYFGFILDVLEEEGMLRKLSEDDEISGSRVTNITWEVAEVKYPPEKIKSCLDSPVFTDQLTKQFNSTQLMVKVSEKFADILKGKQSALTILFPEDKRNTPSVGAFYEEYGKLFGFEELGGAGMSQRVKQFKEAMEGGRFILRILEIGSGTGAFTKLMLETLEELDVEYEYTYTDISAGFFPAAEKKFEKYVKNLKFKKLNIEEHPLSQGFIPEYFDYVVASEVIHATRDILQSLGNVRLLLRPAGKFDLVETTVVNRYITFLVGLLPGYWLFQDHELRPKHCTMPKDKWVWALEKAGFGIDGVFSCLMDQNSMICVHKKPEVSHLSRSLVNDKQKVWLMFQPEVEEISKLADYLRLTLEATHRGFVLVCPTADECSTNTDKTWFKIRRNSEENFKWLLGEVASGGSVVEGVLYCWALDRKLTKQGDLLQPFFYLTKNISALLENCAQQKSLPRVIVLTEGIVPIEDNDLSHYHASTLWGYCKSIRNEMTEFNCRCIDITDGDITGSDLRLKEIFSELFNTEKEPQVAYHERSKFIPKFQPYKPSVQEQNLKLPPGRDRFQLLHPETKAIADLQFGPLDHLVLAKNEVEVQIKVFGLNFRDVLNVLKPTEQFKEKDFNTVGFDFAGVVTRLGSNAKMWKVGDLVFGVNFDGNALPSHTKIREDYVIAVPEHFPLCQAASLPVVFSTAYHCLIEVAKMKPSDTVLIHTASGGVGLSAIDICRYFGVTNIIATAGSQRKRNFLKNMGIKHVFHSRNTSFTDEILRVTNGRGVDLVLNSLTHEGFKEATLRACGKGAWFLEMSKISIWTEEEIKKLRPDINYYVIDVDISTVTPHDWHMRVKSVRQHFLDLRLPSPLPMVMFDATNIRQALVYLQKARQIGKVVCLMPEWSTEDGERKAKIPMFNDKSSYMITGGLGGIGFLICRWMIEKGAKYLILVGRSPPSDKVQKEIEKFNSKEDVCIQVAQLDVGDRKMCEELFLQKLPTMKIPPVRGVMHCAGTLSDGMVTNQDWDKMSQVFNAKVHGTINLHEFTKSQNLEHFVLFSSMAALFGPPGQSNHAAVSSFEDTFAFYRHSIGLPATTVNWGQWGEVGVATEQDFPGIRPISNLQGLTALEHAMKTHRTQTCALNVDSFVLWSKLVPQLSVYLDDRVWKISTGSEGLHIKSDEFWQEYDSKTSFDEKVIVVKEYARRILTSVLRLEEGEKLRDGVDLQEMGVDSLMFVEIKNALQALLGDRITLNTSALRECNTINLISEALVKQIEGVDVSDLEPPSPTQVIELLRKDCVLPDHIRQKSGTQNKVPIKDIHTVLLTGSTGTLGACVLRELLRLKQVTRVVCLLRPKKDSNETIEQRLKKVLDTRGLTDTIDLNIFNQKVEVVPGNCAAPRLGMDDTVWQDLTHRIDAVFNCFANVNHLEHYKERAPHLEDVRNVNIGGTKNILEFCCEARLKHIFHAASLVSVATIDKTDGSISENWPESEDYDGVTTFSYPISKYVEDMLMKEATIERGLPCKVFRLPYLCGDSQTGRFHVQHNHMMLRYIFIMKNGIMPSNPFPLVVLPVDKCAELIVSLSLNENVPCDVFNITHDKPDVDQEFPKIAQKFGSSVKLVEFSEFADRVLKQSEENAPGEGDEGTNDSGYHPILKELYRNQEAFLLLYNTAPAFKHWLEGENREQFFLSKKLQKYKPEFYKGLARSLDFVEKDLVYGKSQGWF